MRRNRWILLWLGAALLFAAPVALAEQNAPGSVVIFPYVDTRSDSGTIITVANVYLRTWPAQRKVTLPNGLERCIDNDPLSFGVGDTGVHFIFFEMFTDDGTGHLDPVENPCQEFDFDVILSANDVVSFDASDFIPTGSIGWLVGIAVDPTQGDPTPWAFDFLVANAYVVESTFNLSWNYNAYPFLSSKVLDPIGPFGMVADQCGKKYTDEQLGVGATKNDGKLTFDGYEYEKWPDELLLARFWEETPRVMNPDFDDPLDFDFDSRLVLISPQNTLPGKHDWQVTYRALFWNNDENTNGFPFSRTRNMKCMDVTTLRDLSAQFTQLGGTTENDEEATGWAVFDGFLTRDQYGTIRNSDAPLLGMFAQIDVKVALAQGQPGNLDRFAEANIMFTRGFNPVLAEIEYRFDDPNRD